jgi:hypothetical protein
VDIAPARLLLDTSIRTGSVLADDTDHLISAAAIDHTGEYIKGRPIVGGLINE